MPVNDDIADALVRHQIGLQRLSNNTVRKVVALLNRSDARIVERLLSADVSELSRARQEALLREIRRVVESVYEDATGALHVELEGLAEYETDYQLDLFRRAVPVPLEFTRPAPDQIIAAVNARPFQGKLLREWYSELSAGAFRRLRDTIRAGFVEGRTTDQIIREVRGTAAQGYKDGILQVNRRAAEATVRTAINHTANAARAKLYEANDDLIKGVKWVSTLDSRTSAVCRARDGQVYPVDKGPRPPAHPNCRSSTTPVLKSWRSLGLKDLPAGKRASMNGAVPEDMDYDAWLRKQPVALQDDILGVKKGRLFRAGLKMDRFVNRAGDELTLDDLKRQEGEYWEKAGLG
ncbi:minor capsid protein [Actibacterium sp. MT2.3-13A]|uniref:minor capsid protein n=1 Tax=Actibacterium sp. MT2.3-13A TaxID=2828332 RepID=UPI001BA5DFAC|nr:minor capsid protein [Actibacterium sp. MT2.3-13A]